MNVVEPEPESESSPLELGRAAAAQFGGGEWQLDAEPVAEAVEPEPPPARPENAPAAHAAGSPRAGTPEANVPPSPEQLVEAMLFVGGHPLTAEVACRAVRGLSGDGFRDAVEALNRRYRRQGRPYVIQSRDDGFVLAVLPAFRGLR